MQSILIGALVIAYICVAYIGPVLAIGFSGYWAYTAFQTGGMSEAAVTFLLSALVLLVALMIAKRVLKYIMNVVDDDDEAAEAHSD